MKTFLAIFFPLFLFVAWLFPGFDFWGRSCDSIWVALEVMLCIFFAFSPGVSKILKPYLFSLYLIINFLVFYDEMVTLGRANQYFDDFIVKYGERNCPVSADFDGAEWKNEGYFSYMYVRGFGSAWKMVYRKVGETYFLNLTSGRHAAVNCLEREQKGSE